MKSKATVIWLFLAAGLAGTIWVLNHYAHTVPPGPKPIFAGLRADQVTGIQVIPAGGREISVTRSNQTWQLEKPFAYPAQTAAIDGLLDALTKLTPQVSFTAGEMTSHKDADAEFGFDNPLFTLDVAAGKQTWHLRVGNKTAPGDGVYVRIVGAPGAYVTDTSWLQFLPHDVSDWRDTTLVTVPDTLDWLVITNGNQAIELRRDVISHLWRMVRPLQTRADNFRIVTALQQLQSAHISRFVSDDPKADLTTYGLDPAGLDVWLGYGTNLLAGVHVGKDVPGMAGEVYARREGWNTIVTTPKEPLAPWRGSVNDFRDPNLLELTAPVAEIEVRGQNSFTLEQQGSNSWTEAGQKFPIEAGQVKSFITMLAALRINDFVQDVVTASGLQSFGLDKPSLQITLLSAAGDTNSAIAQLLFGSVSTNLVYVKRAREDSVYSIALESLKNLPLNGEYFRERQVWDFSETNVTEVTLKQNGKVRQLIRKGVNQWSLAPGSQGILDNPPAVEETVHRLGQLTVAGWLGRKFTPEQIGLTTNSLSITIELKNGEKHTVDFGADIRAQTALASVTLDGEPWAFVFPPVLYPLVAEYLTIPADKQ